MSKCSCTVCNCQTVRSSPLQIFVCEACTDAGHQSRYITYESEAKPKTGLDLLREVEETLTKRGELYGPPKENFARIAAIWTVLLSKKLKDGEEITPNDVARAMMGLKLARSAETPDNEDDYLDAMGYAVLGWDVL